MLLHFRTQKMRKDYHLLGKEVNFKALPRVNSIPELPFYLPVAPSESPAILGVIQHSSCPVGHRFAVIMPTSETASSRRPFAEIYAHWCLWHRKTCSGESTGKAEENWTLLSVLWGLSNQPTYHPFPSLLSGKNSTTISKHIWILIVVDKPVQTRKKILEQW